ncbi:hypothetical protein RvY_11053 [Ramazzottius varieornatus]|uniref:Uncharacterized protein n=1 Tax=Ramazzottius varieornatus TaxID=947166 RepID=A0A1D1VHA1_RAMVA|nr:hypothetical protein RvY_11053 [Ramazzottius varieornatus]
MSLGSQTCLKITISAWLEDVRPRAIKENPYERFCVSPKIIALLSTMLPMGTKDGERVDAAEEPKDRYYATQYVITSP